MADKKSASKSKKQSKVKLTFKPLFSAVKYYTVSLTKNSIEIVNGFETPVRKPAIKGLPSLLTVKAGEVIEVTSKQFEQLKEFHCIETQEQIDERKKIASKIKHQHPESFDVYNKPQDLDRRTIKKIYSDKLVVVE